jgi:hypothetical protein
MISVLVKVNGILVKVNGILVKVNGIRHYFFIDLILPSFITRLHNPIVYSGLFLKQTQAYIYIRLIASGIDEIHNCPKCLKEKHFQKFR